MIRTRILLSLILLLLLNKGFGQDTLAKADLDPVTVTANMLQQKSSATGRDLIVIKGERFSELPVHSIDELLRYLPGIEIQQRGVMGSQGDILMRGGTFQQVLVLLDGIRLNDPLTGHFNAYIPISTAEIERIEIVKGASSAIYGSDAVGGVIHVINKTFNAKKGVPSSSGSAIVKAGQYGLLAGSGGLQLQNKKTSFGLGFNSNTAKGMEQRGTKSFVHNTTGSASVKHYLNDHWSLAYRVAADKRDFSAQNFYTAFTSDTATEKVTTLWHHAQIAYRKDAEQLTLDFGLKSMSDEYAFNKQASPNDNKSSLLQALLTHSYQYNKRFRYQSGLQFLEKSIRSNDRGNHSVYDAGAFLLFGYTPLQNFNFTPALRMNWNESAKLEVIPQLNISIIHGKKVFRGSIGKSIRDADFTERFNNYNKLLVSSGNIGNPYLKEEKSWSYEAGIDWLNNKGVKLSATAFYKQYYQLIDWVLTPYAEMPRKENLIPTGTYFLAKNIANVRTAGIETSIYYNKTFANNTSLFTTAGVSYINSKDQQGSKSLYISSHADVLVNLSAVYRWKQLQLGVNGLYKQRPSQAGNSTLTALTKSYSVLNARIDYTLFNRKAAVFIEADNLMNTNYADRFGVVMPGRWMMLGVRVNGEW